MNMKSEKIKSQFIRLTIARKVYLTNISIVATLIIIFVFLVNNATKDIIVSNAIEASIQNLDLVSENLKGLVDRVDDISKVIAANGDVQVALSSVYIDENDQFEAETELSQTLNNIIEPRSTVSSVVVYGQNGQLFSTSRIRRSLIDPAQTLSSPPYESAIQKQGALIWKNTHPIQYEITSSGQTVNVFTMLRAVLSTEYANTLGIVELNVNQKTISTAYTPATKDSTRKFIMVSNEGIVVSSSDEADLYSDVSQLDYFKWAKVNNRSGAVYKISGNDYVVTINQFRQLNVMLIGIIPLDELTADSSKLSAFLFIIGLAFILIASIMTVIITQTITRPISRLAQIMEDVGQGDLEVRVPVSSNDEVGILTEKFNQMIGKISDLMDNIFDDQIKKRKLEFMALQSQINPHFMYNTLDSICSLAQMGRDKDVFDMTKSLSMFYRSVLSKGRSIITIKEEIDNVKYYLTIQKIRYFDKLEYKIDCDPLILDSFIVKLSVQPLVENAIYHAIKNKTGMGMIEITGKTLDDQIVISVRDNAGSFDMSKVPDILNNRMSVSEGNGFGLTNVNERIRLNFGEQFGLRINCEENVYTQVDIVLPSDWKYEDDKDYNN